MGGLQSTLTRGGSAAQLRSGAPESERRRGVETLRYILRRLLQMIPVLVISVVAIFLLMRLLPGDAALATLGDK